MSSSVGRLALGVVGAVIGAPFGLAAVGFSIGSAIGGFAFAPDGPNQEGPRMGDLDVQASVLGKTLPEHYGVTRTSGNMIWSAGLKETKTVTEVSGGGGKGGGGQGGTQTTYSYSASYAVALGRAPAIELVRMWADGKLIYDVTGQGKVQNDKYTFRFWKGGTDQPVDPLISESINRRLQGLPDINEGTGEQATYKTIANLIGEANASSDPRSAIYSSYLTARKNEADAAEGTPSDYRFTPAYREFTYVVFDDMPLEDFANRIPNITAEVVWTAKADLDLADTISEYDVTEISAETTPPVSGVGVDPASETLLVLSNNTQLRKFNRNQLAEVLDVSNVSTIQTNAQEPGETTKTLVSTVQEILGATESGDFVARFGRSGETSTDIIAIISNASLDSLTGGSGSWYSFTVPEMSESAASCTFGCAVGTSANRSLFAGCNPDGDLVIFDTSSTTIAYAGSSLSVAPDSDGVMVKGISEDGLATFFWAPDNGTDWYLYKVQVRYTPAQNISGKSYYSPTYVASYTAITLTVIDSGIGTGQRANSMVFDSATNSLLLLLDTGSAGLVRKYNPFAAGTMTDPYLEYNKALTNPPPNPKSGLQRSRIAAGTLAYAYQQDVTFIDVATGDESLVEDIISGTASRDVQIYSDTLDALFTWVDGEPKQLTFGRLSAGAYFTELSQIIETVCQRIGMESDEYDLTELGSIPVRGYSVTRPSTGRAVLENLLTAFYVDGIETDWTVKFKPRSTTSVRTITESELGGVRSPTGEVVWLESRQPEYDLPAEIAMIYTDVDRDYQQGSAHKRRTVYPNPTMYARKSEDLEMPIVLNEVEARDIAERLLYLTWMSRDTAKGKLPWTHLDLDPTDVVTISLANGTRVLTDRISKTEIGANFEIDIDTMRSGDPVYESAAAAAVGSANVPSISVQTPEFSKLFILDIPLLEDYHDTARTSQRYYAAVGSDTSAWVSAALYQSSDSLSYENFDTLNVDATWGQVVGRGLNPPRTLFTTDKENTLKIRLSVDNGDVVSATRDEIINQKANRALIWNADTGNAEIIQFQNVTDNGDGTYTLDTLLRGLRGTDYYVDGHVRGEFFILLTEATITPEVNSLALIGSTMYYKAVSRGALIGAAPSVSLTVQGRALMPWAPGAVRRSDDGSDLTITWTRRTRIGGEWNMTGTGVEVVPLNEDSEAYEFYLLPNDTEALDNFDPGNPATYEVLKSRGVTNATITAAELATAGYTLADTVYVAVYQISAQVGRGFPRLVALPA